MLKLPHNCTHLTAPHSSTLAWKIPWTEEPGGLPSTQMNTRVCRHSLLQGIFPTQASNPGLLHCRRIPYYLSHQHSYFNRTDYPGWSDMWALVWLH